MKAKPKRTGEKKPPTTKAYRFWILLGLVLAGLYFAGQFSENQKSEIVSYSFIKEQIRNQKVQKIFIGTENIEAIPIGTLADAESSKWVALRVEDPGLVTLLEERKIPYEARASTGGIQDFIFTWVIPLTIMYFVWQLLIGRAMRQGPPGFAAFGKSKARLVTQKKEKTSFKDVAGAEEAKEELSEIIEFLKSPEKFRDIGGRIPKGVLLVGPPGTGKTLLARAVAGEAGVAFMQLSGSDFVEMFVGVGAARVRDLFLEASKASPCIVFIDELDAIAKSRGIGGFQTNDEREQTLNQILVEMDGFDNHQGVIIMAATNRPEVLDPAILRPGRFDRQIVVNKPDIKEREEILAVHASKIKIKSEVDLKKVAARTPGFSGADLANVVNEAALLAVRRGLKSADSQSFEDAIDRVVAGLAKKNRVISMDEKRTIAIHETGHALVAHFTQGADKVHRISIVPRSSGALGFTLQIPEEDRHLMTETQLKSMIRVLLGGRAAEKMVLGEVSSGAHDDLKRATSIAKRMIYEFGMSESVGLVSLNQQNAGFLENPFVKDDSVPMSDALSLEVDRELRKILDQEFEKACQIIAKNRFSMDRLTQRLLEKETLEAVEFEEILANSNAQTTRPEMQV